MLIYDKGLEQLSLEPILSSTEPNSKANVCLLVFQIHLSAFLGVLNCE